MTCAEKKMKEYFAGLAVVVIFAFYCAKIVDSTVKIDDQIANDEIRFVDKIHALLDAGFGKLGADQALVEKLMTTYDVFDPYKHNKQRASMFFFQRGRVAAQRLDIAKLDSWLKVIPGILCVGHLSLQGETRARYCDGDTGYMFGQRDLAAIQKLIWDKGGDIRYKGAPLNPQGKSRIFYECDTDNQCREAYGEQHGDRCADNWCVSGFCTCIHRD